MKRVSLFCTNENYHCKCVKCMLALETARKIELRQAEKELENQTKNGLRHNGGKLPIELLKEVL